MTLYVITAIRLAAGGEVSHVRWARADGARNKFEERPYEVPVDRVVEAFDRKDNVELVFTIDTGGTVSGGRLLRKVLPDGRETVRRERTDDGRTLADMPRF